MLKRKMFRDIRFNKSQFITIFLMVFIGILAYAGIRSYMDGMANLANKFYTECNLQDLSAVGENFTEDDLKQIKQIEHVKNAERKLTISGTIDSEEDKTLQLNFIESNEISKFHVIDGIKFNKETKGLWLDEYFANKNNLKVGDTIKIKYDGETIEEKIIALINVPDHVYDIKDESAIFPTHVDYGFAYLSINEFPESYVKKQAMKKANITEEMVFDLIMPDFNYKNYLIYNYMLIDVDKEENKNIVKNKVEEDIEDAIAVTDIKDSLSYATYQGEIEEGETYCGVFSGLFLFIAILSVITTMTRVVKKQRIQIGTLKALGFKKRKITAHYVGYGFWISLIAAILGLIAGPILIGNIFLNLELAYYQLPGGNATVSTEGFVMATLVVLAITIVTYLTCRRTIKRKPCRNFKDRNTKSKTKKLKYYHKRYIQKNEVFI